MENAEQLRDMRDYHATCKEPIKSLQDEVKKGESVCSNLLTICLKIPEMLWIKLERISIFIHGIF